MSAAMSKAQRLKGESFLNEAERTLSKKTWFSSSSEQKYEDAAELFERAANAYKVGHYHDEAGKAYKKAARLYQEKLSNLGEASKALGNAGACFKKSNPAEAVTAYQEAVTMLCDAGRLTQAAKVSKEVAQLYETDMSSSSSDTSSSDDNPTTLAIQSYEQAAELFAMEEQKSQASQCKAKIAELCSAQLDPPDLLKAANLYETLGRECLESQLLKYNAKGYFLQAIFCHLAHSDALAASQSYDKYRQWDFTFEDAREGKLCAALVECVEQYDAEGFATACYEYDRISKLDPWKTTMLVKVKRGIEEEAGGVGGSGIGADAECDEDVDLT